MKRKTVKVGDREMVIEAFDTPLQVGVGQTVDDLNREIAGEEELYDALDALARDAARRLKSAGTGTRAAAYWQIGRMINELLTIVKKDAGSAGTRPFQKRERIEETLLQRLSDELREGGVEKSEYSKPYLRKMSRLAQIMTAEQVERPVAYPLFHELLHDELSGQEIDQFLDRCERGEFGKSDNMRLRSAVNRYLFERETAPLSIPFDLKEQLLARAGKGESLRKLRRELAVAREDRFPARGQAPTRNETQPE
jgi:hypothetical protein